MDLIFNKIYSTRPRTKAGVFISMANNIERRHQNVNNATGRVAGQFLLNGDPRGGGGGYCEKTVVTFYKAVDLSDDEIFATLGVADDGERTPYELLRAAVKPQQMTKIVTFDKSGRPSSTELLPLG